MDAFPKKELSAYRFTAAALAQYPVIRGEIFPSA
jgi:hypothetical protein